MAKVVQNKKLYQQVVENITGMIAQGRYRTGDLLPSEKELMDQMGVSRVTVREGLRLLNESGIIESIKGKGSYVRMDLRQIQEQQEVKDYQRKFMESTALRLILEPAAAKQVAETCDEKTRRSLEKYLCTDVPDLEDFHMAIIRATDNYLLVEIFNQLICAEGELPASGLSLPSEQQYTANELREQHLRIYQAIMDRDGKRASELMHEHLEYVRAAYEEYFRSLIS